MAEKVCTIDGCTGRHASRGWCEMHYSRWKRWGDPLTLKVARTSDGLCRVDGCSSPPRGLGWCSKHYQRWRTHGDPLGLVSDVDHRIQFLSRVEIDPSGCWLWTGKLDTHGYGRSPGYGLTKNGGMAHRVAYMMFVGPIPDGLELDHVYANGCRNHNCVNWVDHLEPVTHAENMRRHHAVRQPIDRCRRAGHPYDEANTRIDALGHRICRACDKSPERKAAGAARARAKRARLRAEAA